QRTAQFGRVDVARDADETRSMIGVGPAGQTLGCVKYSLHALHEHYLTGLRDFEQALAAQQPVAELGAGDAPPRGDAGPRGWMRQDEGAGADAVGVVDVETAPIGGADAGVDDAVGQAVALTGPEQRRQRAGIMSVE